MHISCRLSLFTYSMQEIGLRKLRSEQQDGETDRSTDLTELFYKGEDLRCKHFARSHKNCLLLSPILPFPDLVPCLMHKITTLFLCELRAFFNTVKFNLCSTLQCFGKLQLRVGPRICGRCILWVNLERVTFIYTYQQVLVNFPCRVILVC